MMLIIMMVMMIRFSALEKDIYTIRNLCLCFLFVFRTKHQYNVPSLYIDNIFNK